MMAVKGMRRNEDVREMRDVVRVDTFSYEMNELWATNVLPHGYSSHRIMYFKVAQRCSKCSHQ